MSDYSTKGIIKSVNDDETYYSISLSNSYVFGLDKKYQVKPEVGDSIEVISVGTSFGIIRGVNLNDHIVFYQTDEELEAEEIARKKAQREKELSEFEENKAELNRRYNALPEIFRQRIDRFRRNNPDFRIKFEPYELYCCEEAIKIAVACEDYPRVEAFNAMSYETQKLVVPTLDDGHSGNTFGCSVKLAYWYLKQPENVVKLHGALSPLVGSVAYGDIDKSENEK